MELKILAIGDKNNLENERIAISVLKDCELKFFMLFSTYFSETGGFYHVADSAFWFVPQKVIAGDKIVIYTRKGGKSSKVNEDLSTTYFYYWGLEKTIFTSDNKGVVLSKVQNWEISKGK